MILFVTRTKMRWVIVMRTFRKCSIFVYSQAIHMDMDEWVMDGYLENVDDWVGASAIGWDHWLTTIYDKLIDMWFEADG